MQVFLLHPSVIRVMVADYESQQELVVTSLFLFRRLLGVILSGFGRERCPSCWPGYGVSVHRYREGDAGLTSHCILRRPLTSSGFWPLNV